MSNPTPPERVIHWRKSLQAPATPRCCWTCFNFSDHTAWCDQFSSHVPREYADTIPNTCQHYEDEIPF